MYYVYLQSSRKRYRQQVSFPVSTSGLSALYSALGIQTESIDTVLSDKNVGEILIKLGHHFPVTKEWMARPWIQYVGRL